MGEPIPSGLREFDRWLNASLAEADSIVPDLLALPGPLLLRELRMRPSLRTAGVMRRLLAVARDSINFLPSRTHELTLAVARYSRSMDVPAEFAFISRTLQGEAWRDHAIALRELGRTEKAEQAIRCARRCFRQVPVNSLYEATVDLIEAPLLHDRGRHDEALRMIRRAGHRFELSRDHDRFLEARMTESWMLWAAGDRDRAGELWKATAEAARLRGDRALVARLAAKMGLFELRYGCAEDASRLLAASLELFDDAPASEAAIRTRWHLAEATAAAGRLPAAISEYHIIRTHLFARGAMTQAALAAVEVIDLHLLDGREDQLPSLLTTFVHAFRDVGLGVNAMEALAYLRARADADALTRGDVRLVRAFFEDLPQNPYGRFRAP